LGDVARICGVSRRRLRYWEQTALVQARAEEGLQPGFDFRDLVSVRSIVGLLERGVPLQRIRRSVEAVRDHLPQADPITALRWQAVARCVVVRHDGVLMEPDGQLVLEFAPAKPEGDGSVAPLEPRTPDAGSHEARRLAMRWFERGCELDADRATWEEAALAYREAIGADPAYADAHCNLGSVYFNQGSRDRARACFERAIDLEPGHVEANLNLGTILEELTRNDEALHCYRAALETDPLYADVHVSLGLLYEKLGLRRTALSHWRRYLQLDPRGTWADVARRRLRAH
jgi:DNA-binding transcriptional MerR regulator